MFQATFCSAAGHCAVMLTAGELTGGGEQEASRLMMDPYHLQLDYLRFLLCGVTEEDFSLFPSVSVVQERDSRHRSWTALQRTVDAVSRRY